MGLFWVFFVIWEQLPPVKGLLLPTWWCGGGGAKGWGQACCGWWTDTGMMRLGGLCPISHRHVTLPARAHLR